MLRAGNLQMIGGKCYELRAGNFLGGFQVAFSSKALLRKIQAKVSLTRHTRRTGPTLELNPRAKLHQATFKALSGARLFKQKFVLLVIRVVPVLRRS